jgi:hypothetical protein
MDPSIIGERGQLVKGQDTGIKMLSAAGVPRRRLEGEADGKENEALSSEPAHEEETSEQCGEDEPLAQV